MAGIDYLDGGGDDYNWRDWIQEERNLDQPAYEPPRIEPVPEPSPEPTYTTQAAQRSDPDPAPSPAPSPSNNSNDGGGGGWSPPANDPHQEAPGVNEMINRDQGSWEKRLREAGGSLFDQSDLEGIIRQVSYASNVGKDPDQFLREAEQRYKDRRGSTSDRPFDSQGPYYDQRTNQLNPAGLAELARLQQKPQPAPARPGALGSQALAPQNYQQNYQRPDVNVPNQFSDSITKWIEQFAQMRAQELENPKPNSGQALLEQILREVSQDFRGGGYTPQEMEVFQTQSLDPLEKLRQARKQQVLHTLATRGISPNSGIGISMLADVDRQFDAQRSEVQRSIAGDGARERTNRIQQAVQLLSGLAGTENQRLDQAFQYRSVPLNLADRSFNQASQVFGMNETSANNAFNRAFQLFNASGNPLTLANPLIQLQQLQQGRQDNWQEALGYLAYILANGGKMAA